MPNAATTRIRRSTKAYTGKRDARLRAVDAPLTTWLTGVEREIAGIMATHSGTARQLEQKLVPVLDDVQTDGAAEMEKLLRRTWNWGWDTATADFIAVYPMEYWVRRHLPLNRMAVTESITEDAYHAATDAGIDRILSGEATEAEAREIVRQLEFAPPSEDFVTTVLNETVADDGMSAMKRIVSVTETDKRSLLDTLVTGFSEGADITKMTSAIRQYVGNVHYKAARIARTEGVRVAQAGLDKTWEEAGDIVEGIQWFSALLPQTRPDHAELHDKIYTKTSGGMIAADGSSLPPVPLGPNCLCWTSPVLPDFDSLIPGLPKVDLGEPFETGRKRAVAQGVGADLKDFKAKRAARKAATKRKPKAAAKPRPKAPAKLTPAKRRAQAVEKSEKTIQSRSTEQLRVFDSTGKLVATVDGTESSVRASIKLKRQIESGEFTTLHNHPLHDGVATSFSPADINGGISLREIETRIITQDGTRYSMKYSDSIRSLSGVNRAKLADHVTKDYDRSLTRKTRQLIKDAKARGVSAEEMLHAIKTEVAEASHTAWIETAKRHDGLVYRKLPALGG